MKKSGFLSRLLLDWALICVGVLGSLYCLTTVEAYGLRMPALVPILVLVLALFCCLLFQGKTGKYYALGVLGLLLLLGWLFREDLIEGLRALWGVLQNYYRKGYDWLARLKPQEPWEPEAAAFGIAALACFETYFCALSVRLWKRTTPAALSILPGVAACFVLTDTLPDKLALLAVAFSVLVQAFSQSARRRQTDEHPKVVGLAALLSAILLGLLLLFLPEQKDFKSPITWNDLTEKLERWGDEQNNIGNTIAGFSGNPEAVDLTTLSSLPNRPIPVLYVTSAKSAYLYLRGSSYMDFDGSHWARGAQWQGDWRASFPYLERNDGFNLSIDTRSPEAVLYTAYQLTDLPNSGTVVGDAYVENTDGVDSYSMRVLEDSFPAASIDTAYDAWVLENCLSVPEKTSAAVLAWWEEHGADVGMPPAMNWYGAPAAVVSHGEEGDVVLRFSAYLNQEQGAEPLTDFARQVASKISETARYSRDPARVPADAEDFCGWFLNEAEEGYCVHYATACTALLRALGLPCRYASGYVCEAVGGERTRVTNLQAHAWVELWTGGRWVVIEPTPDYATEFTGIVDPDASEAETETRQEPGTETEAPPPPEVTKHRPDEPTDPTERPEPTETKPTEPGSPGGSDPNNGKGRLNPRELTGLWVLGVLLLILGRRVLVLRLRERRLRRTKGNERARLLYRYILRLQKLIDNGIPPEVTELAHKAAYSHHELDDKELAYLRQIYEQQKSRLMISGFLRRLWCKYVLAVI